MANETYIIQLSTLKEIADAIRAISGSTAPIPVTDLGKAILEAFSNLDIPDNPDEPTVPVKLSTPYIYLEETTEPDDPDIPVKPTKLSAPVIRVETIHNQLATPTIRLTEKLTTPSIAFDVAYADMPTPTIELDGDSLLIYDNSGAAEQFDILVNGSVAAVVDVEKGA